MILGHIVRLFVGGENGIRMILAVTPDPRMSRGCGLNDVIADACRCELW